MSRTRADAYEFVRDYERANDDLPPDLRRLLAVFALAAAKYRAEIYDGILGYESSVPRRDMSRRWWLVLATTGTERYWDMFKSQCERLGTGEAWKRLQNRASARRVREWRRRLGYTPSKYDVAASRPSDYYWFKQGSWKHNANMTKLLITGEPVRRSVNTRRWMNKLPPERVRTIERELVKLVDPDEHTIPEAYGIARDYVHNRLNDIYGKEVSLVRVAWVLNTNIPVRNGYASRRKSWFFPDSKGYVQRQWH